MQSRSGAEPSISIVVPTLNEELYLGRLLQSLADQLVTFSFEVIVVDSSPNALTAGVADSFGTRLDIRVLRFSKRDVGSQRNVGWRAAKSDRILFLDADTVLPASILSLLQKRNFGGAYVVSIRHTSQAGGPVVRLAVLALHLLVGLARVFRVPVAIGDFTFTSRETLEVTGGFKEGYALGEDTDFGIRAKRLGARSYMIWRQAIAGSPRRLEYMSAHKLIWIWSRAFLRAIRESPPPSGTVDYPFGLWGTASSREPKRNGTSSPPAPQPPVV